MVRHILLFVLLLSTLGIARAMPSSPAPLYCGAAVHFEIYDPQGRRMAPVTRWDNFRATGGRRICLYAAPRR